MDIFIMLLNSKIILIFHFLLLNFAFSVYASYDWKFLLYKIKFQEIKLAEGTLILGSMTKGE